jgi:hypothetical protein
LAEQTAQVTFTAGQDARISRCTYQAALRRSSIGAPFSSARQRYLIALPTLKPMCSTTVMHSTPDGWAL